MSYKFQLFDQFKVGNIDHLGKVQVTADQRAAFAAALGFNPDAEEANRWLTVSLQLRVMVEELLNRSSSQGAPGLDEVQWGERVQPGDTLTVRCEVLDTRTSGSRPDLGLVRFRFDTLNQRLQAVLTVHQWMMFAREAAPAHATLRPPGTSANVLTRYEPPMNRAPLIPDAGCWKDWHRPVAGTVADLGSFRFDVDDIIAFARAFDPQPFHVDPEAARRSLFGRLCASGLHTAVIWASLAQHGPWVVPSNGMRGLKWHRPVFAGEIIRFRSTIKSAASDNAGSGLTHIARLNEAIDAAGSVVMRFEDEVAIKPAD